MSLKLLRNTRSCEASRTFGSPVVFELLVALEHREEAEVHRAHVERGDLRPPLLRRPDALLDGHVRRAAGGDIDHDVRRLLDAAQEGLECFGALIRPSIRRIARVQMHDRRAASAAPTRSRRFPRAVTGRCGDIEGVWIDPVTAQLTMTFRFPMTFPPIPQNLLAAADQRSPSRSRWPAARWRSTLARARVIEAAQVRGPVFGDDDVRIHASQRYRARFRAGRDDAADRASGRRRRESENAQAAPGTNASREIGRAPRPGHQSGGPEFGIGLPVEIDFERGIERHEPSRTRDDARRVGVGHRMKAIGAGSHAIVEAARTDRDAAGDADAGASAPASSRSTTASGMRPEWISGFVGLSSARNAAVGILPRPIWIVAPSLDEPRDILADRLRKRNRPAVAREAEQFLLAST